MTCKHGCCDSDLEHWKSVTVAPSATPSRSPGHTHAAETADRESRWDEDMAAYLRLRRDGLQPKTIDGSAEAEARGDSKMEIEAGVQLDAVQKATVDDILSETDAA